MIGSGVSPAALRDVCTSLAQLLESGMAANEAVRMIGSAARPALRIELLNTARSLDSGRDLGQALRGSKVFDDDQVAVIEAFQAIGRPGAGFEAIADALEDQIQIRNQLLKSVAYPIMVLLAYVFISPVPKLVLSTAGAYGRAVGKGLGGLVLLVVVFGVLLPRLLRLPAVREKAWRMPWPATIYITHVRAVFCRTLARNMDAGIELFRSLRGAAAATADLTARRRIRSAESNIRLTGLSQQLVRTELIAREDSMLIVSGEKSGNLVQSLKKIGERYAEKRQRGQRRLTMVVSGLLTASVAIMVALGVIDAYRGVSGAAEGIMDGMDLEAPFKDIQDIKGLDGVKGLDGLDFDPMKELNEIRPIKRGGGR